MTAGTVRLPSNMPPNERPTIVLAGAGGIGARVLPTLVKMLVPPQVQLGLEEVENPAMIHVVDPDLVEERNTFRQPFIDRDVGMSKAEVLARRYSTPHVEIIPHVAKVEEALLGLNWDKFLFLGCVDGKAPRKAMLDFMTSKAGPQSLYIDAGNDGNWGQIAIARGHFLDDYTDGFTLMGDAAFPELFDGVEEPPREEEQIALPENMTLGCGLKLDTQTPVTNTFAASLMLNYIHLYLSGGVLASLGCRFSTLGNVEWVRMKKQADPTYRVRGVWVPLDAAGE